MKKCYHNQREIITHIFQGRLVGWKQSRDCSEAIGVNLLNIGIMLVTFTEKL